MAELKCPLCREKKTELNPVGEVVLQQFAAQNNGVSLPESVCEGCLSELVKKLQPNVAALVKEGFRDQTRLALWQARIGLVRWARQQMREKHYGEAVVAYEKYLKVLEIALQTPIALLSADAFRDPSTQQELTVLTAVHWDLLRLYEANEKYQLQADLAYRKLLDFVPATNLKIQIVKAAEAHRKKARAPDLFKGLAKKLMLPH